MKCPKCNYVSFEHLKQCRKCGIDLNAHKAELGINFPESYDLGIVGYLHSMQSAKQETYHAMPTAVAEEESDLMEEEAVALEEEMVAADEEAPATYEIEEEEEAPDAGGIELGSSEDLDLSDIGGSPDETASISLADLDEDITGTATGGGSEGIDFSGLGDDADDSAEYTPEAATEVEEGSISFDAMEEGGEESISLDLQDLEEEEAEETPAAETTADEFELDLSDIGESEEPEEDSEEELDLSGEDGETTPVLNESDAIDALGDSGDLNLDLEDVSIVEEPAEDEQTAQAQRGTIGVDSISMDDLDLDLSMDDGDGSLDEPKKEDETKKEKKDVDDIDLDDLELELD